MSEVLSSDASSRGGAFPFTTLPNFEVVTAAVREESGAELIAYAPLVESANEIPAWLDYSVANQDWLSSSVETLVHKGEIPIPYDLDPISPIVYNLLDAENRTEAEGAGPFAPLWQLSPPPLTSKAINLNLLNVSIYNLVFQLLNETREAQYTRIVEPGELNTIPGLSLDRQGQSAQNESLVESQRDDRAQLVYFAPIFEDPYDVSSPLRAFLFSFFAWDRYVVDLLPDGVSGIICVIRNTCGQAISYELVGHGVSPRTNACIGILLVWTTDNLIFFYILLRTGTIPRSWGLSRRKVLRHRSSRSFSQGQSHSRGMGQRGMSL